MKTLKRISLAVLVVLCLSVLFRFVADWRERSAALQCVTGGFMVGRDCILASSWQIWGENRLALFRLVRDEPFFFVSKAGIVHSTPCKQYLRTDGKPNAYEDTFRATPPAAKVSIRNGDAAGSNRVSSAAISVNGVKIFQPDDFSRQVYRLEKTINISDTNTLVVELSSQPGSYLNLCIDKAPIANAGAD